MRIYCTVCSDIFDESENIVSTQCGHIFHYACLCRWLEQANSCPQCRNKITKSKLIKLFFNLLQSEEKVQLNYCESDFHEMQARVTQKEEEIERERENYRTLTLQYKEVEDSAVDIKRKFRACVSSEKSLKLQVKDMSEQIKVLKSSQEKVKELETKVKFFKRLEAVVVQSQKEFESILGSYDTGSDAVKELVSFCSLLKRELLNANNSKQELKRKIMSLRKQIEDNSSAISHHICERRKLEDLVMKLQAEKEILEKQISASHVQDPVSSLDVSLDVMKGKAFVSEEKLSKTPTVNQIRPGSSKRFKVDIASFERKLKLPRSDSQISNNHNASIFKFTQKMRKRTQEDKDSIIRTGYNGLGGHSNYVKISSYIKK